MDDLFPCHKDIPNCIWANSFNDGTLRTTGNFASALSKLIMLNYLICLRFLQCRLFPLFVLILKLFAEACTSTKLRDSENMDGGVSFLIILKNLSQKFVSIFSYNFPRPYLKGYFPMKLPFWESVINQCHNKWNKDL